MRSTTIETPSVSENRMNSWRLSLHIRPASVRISIAWNHSASVSSTSLTKACRCLTRPSMICRSRGSDVCEKRCSASAVMSSSVLLRWTGIATLPSLMRFEGRDIAETCRRRTESALISPLAGRDEVTSDGGSDGVGDFLAVGAAEPRAGVPPRGGREIPVITLRYIMQGWRIYVEVGVDEPGALGLCRIDAGEQTRPQRRDRARSANDGVLAVDPHVVSGLRVGVAADVGDAPHSQRLRSTLGARDLQPLLVWRQCKKAADPAAGRSTVGAVVPHRLLRDRGAGGLQTGAAACQGIRARRREIDVIGAVADAVIRPVVAGCHAHRYPHRGGGLENLVEWGHT